MGRWSCQSDWRDTAFSNSAPRGSVLTDGLTSPPCNVATVELILLIGTMPAKKKNSLVENINRRKKAGKSRSEKDSTVSAEAYREMENGWPKSGAAKQKKK